MSQRRQFVVCWTWKQHRRVKTKKRGNEVLKVWKRWYERQGWKVQSVYGDTEGYIALAPGYENVLHWNGPFPSDFLHSISLREYDPISKERIS